MRKEISAMELQLGELLDRVHINGDQLIIKSADKPLAAIVPIAVYEQMIKQRAEIFSVLDKNIEKSANCQ